MLLKRIDEIIVNGLYDMVSQSDDVNVYLAEPILDTEKQIFHWKKVDENKVNRSVLHYDDTNDGSNNFLQSFQKFYASEKDFGECKIYNGSHNIFEYGLPKFGGSAKAAVYLRYSAGFINFLKTFDLETAAKLENERLDFESFLMHGLPEGKTNKTKLMPPAWFDKPNNIRKDNWVLTAICKLSNGKYIVPFLEAGANSDDYEDLDDLGIDVKHSLALNPFFTRPAVKEQEVIDDLFQMRKGLGRNPFGRLLEENNPDSEYLRLMGTIPQSTRTQILELWKNRSSIEYRLPFYPNPEASSLIFLPEAGLKFSLLASFINSENRRNKLFFDALNAKKKC